MQIKKYMFLALTLIGIAVASLITISLLAGSTVFYIAAVWLTLIMVLTVVIALWRAYERIAGRIGTANVRLAEIKLLQESRYEQTRARLDHLLQAADSTSKLIKDASKSGEQVIEYPVGKSGRHDEIAELSAHFQRTERRIIGRLENEFHENDIRNRQMNILVSRIETAFQKADLNDG